MRFGMILAIGLAGFALLHSNGARADDVGVDFAFMYGNELLKDCSRVDTATNMIGGKNAQELLEGSVCYGFITATVDTLHELQRMQNFCLSSMDSTLNAYQLIDVVTVYLKSHPETRNLPAAYLTITAFVSSFPCPK